MIAIVTVRVADLINLDFKSELRRAVALQCNMDG